jgi:hypothetical protein
MLRAAVGTTRRESGTLSGRKRQGLYDRTRARHQDPQRIPHELERAILSIRRRLQTHAAPAPPLLFDQGHGHSCQAESPGNLSALLRTDHRVSDVLFGSELG